MANPQGAQALLALDLESVLVPEFWPAVAHATGIAELLRTTRDESDYARLMDTRIRACLRHGVPLAAIQRILEGLVPLPGAVTFLEWARERMPVVLLSDTFEELAFPLLRKLGQPLLLGHSLEISDDGFILRARIREPHAKRSAVRAFQGLGYCVIAVGDSFNDLEMLESADHGLWFCPPPEVAARIPRAPVVQDFDALSTAITISLASRPPEDESCVDRHLAPS